MSGAALRALVVSIHDVSPLTWRTAERMRKELAGLGVTRCSLLVIPNHHHRGHFSEDAGMCKWLSARVAGGDEVVLHGYFHQRPRGRGEPLLTRLMTRVYTAGEGEFHDLDEAGARSLVSQGRDEFRDAGFEPLGFIAPAWLLSAPAESALRALGFHYTTRLGSITDFATGRVTRSQSLVYSVRAPWRRKCSLGWNHCLSARLRTNPVLRIGLHPPDQAHDAIWRQARRLITHALEDRTTLTYAGWLDAGQS